MPFDDDEQFLRRIPHYQFNSEEQKIDSWAFANDPDTPDRLSVNWRQLSSVQQTARILPGSGVASITAEVCYREDQAIEHTPEEDNDAHCDVIGNKKSKARQRRLRDSAKLLLAPIQPDPPNP